MRMKSKTSRFIAAAVMVPAVLLISALSVHDARNNGYAFSAVLIGRGELKNTLEIPLSEAENIEINYTSKNIKVYPTEGNAVIIKEYLIGDREESKATVSVEEDGNGGHTAVVTGGKGTFSFLSFGIGERIEVYVPREGLEKLSIRTASGNISTADELSLKTKKLQVTAGSGNIRWENSKADEFHIQAGSGNLKLENMTGNAEIQTGSGNITAKQISGQGTVTAGSGNATVEVSKLTGDISLKTGSGNIRLTLPEDLSFRFHVQTGSGNIHTSFDQFLSYNKKRNEAQGEVGENPSGSVRVEANSGNVTITAAP